MSKISVPSVASSTPLKPALASIKASCDYMGGISRAKFYADILPLLKTIKLGNRNLVVIDSMDQFIDATLNGPMPPIGGVATISQKRRGQA
jgi:hypothetical protein